MAKQTIYYISDKTGSDDNPGTSPQKALRSLAAIGERVLAPGDEIRLERGSVFRGQALHLCAQGTAGSPIVVGSYGEGPLPVIQARGSGLWYQDYGCELDTPTHVWRGYVSSAVLLYDCEYIRLEDLEICNDGPVRGERYSQADKLNRTGVAVVAQQRGTLHNIELQRLYIHDVRGNVYDKHLNNGGIYCTALRPTDPAAGIARYDGLYIHHCRVENCSRWGIAAGYTYTHSFFTGKELDDKVVETYGHTNVVLEYNFVRDIGGDGITPMYCLRPLVQFNVSDRVANEINDQVYTLAGERAGKTAAENQNIFSRFRHIPVIIHNLNSLFNSLNRRDNRMPANSRYNHIRAKLLDQLRRNLCAETHLNRTLCHFTLQVFSVSSDSLLEGLLFNHTHQTAQTVILLTEYYLMASLCSRDSSLHAGRAASRNQHTLFLTGNKCKFVIAVPSDLRID